MRILELLAGKKAPNYAKKPKMEVQLRDNWSAVVKFMRTLGIQGKLGVVSFQSCVVGYFIWLFATHTPRSMLLV